MSSRSVRRGRCVSSPWERYPAISPQGAVPAALCSSQGEAGGSGPHQKNKSLGGNAPCGSALGTSLCGNAPCRSAPAARKRPWSILGGCQQHCKPPFGTSILPQQPGCAARVILRLQGLCVRDPGGTTGSSETFRGDPATGAGKKACSQGEPPHSPPPLPRGLPHAWGAAGAAGAARNCRTLG